MAIEIKFFVDKKKNQVVFAECDADFVDVLFSFMTLPLGTIVRLLKKQSGLGCMDNLYESVEKLDDQYLQTAPCKTMLLQPRCAAEKLCEDLVININDLEPPRILMCQNLDCILSKTSCYYSSICGVICSCGQSLDTDMLFDKQSEGDGIFVKRAAKFVVSDELRVSVSSVGAAVSLLQNLHIDDATTLEEKNIQVGKAEVLQLLKRSFVSRTPLSDVFLGIPNDTKAIKVETSIVTKIKSEDDKSSTKIKQEEASNEPIAIKVKILESKSDNEAYIMESGNNFVDLLFSFLTFPLGCVMSLLRKNSSSFTHGCINNLYKSIGELSEDNEGSLLVNSKNMLLKPKLHPYFGCSNQILKVVEMQSSVGHITGCKTCWQTEAALRDKECLHGVPNLLITEINPKMQEASSEKGGGFARTSMRFLITTEELAVKPASAFTTVQLLKNRGVSFNNLRERVVTIGETEALNLLKACLSSTKAIDTSFLL